MAETGASKLDFSFTSNLLIEVDDIQNVRLESDGGDLLYENEGRILYDQQESLSTGYVYDLILLEESDGVNPVYIAMENSMTEEVDIGTDLKIREEMIKKSNGRRTVPQIFIEDNHIGGYEELRALEKNGELKNILGN